MYITVVIRGFLLRTVAIVAVAGQLQALPAALACASQHDDAVTEHCADLMLADGPSVVANDGGSSTPLCELGIGCATAAPALKVTPGAIVFAGDVLAVPARAALAPASFDSSPTPPPPQA